MQTASRIDVPSQPMFLDESEKLVRTLRRFSKKKLGQLMNISDSLVELNAQRFNQWQPENSPSNSRPALQAFRGDVYIGLDADTLNKRDLKYAQAHLRMLSGLYGVLKPFDSIQAYRLEMGTGLKTRRGLSLYDFWGDRITDHLNGEMQEKGFDLVVNLASQEYFKSVNKNKLSGSLVSPVFKDEKNGQYKVISFFAKKARGAMARHLIKNKADSVDAVCAFDSLGYQWDKRSSSHAQPVFVRSEKAAQPYLA